MVIRMAALTPVPDTEDAAFAGGEGAPSDTAMAQAIERLVRAEHRSTAEILEDLRRNFPNSPLAMRVRALEVLRRR
jgi:hypothetical protein